MISKVCAELVNLANGSLAAGDTLAAKICFDAIAEIEHTRNAVRLCIGRRIDIPWPDVTDRDVDSCVDFVKEEDSGLTHRIDPGRIR